MIVWSMTQMAHFISAVELFSYEFYLRVHVFTVARSVGVVSLLDSGAVGPGFKSQPRRCWVAVLGKLITPIVPLFTKQRNW